MKLRDRIQNLDKKIFFILSTARTRSSWFGNFFTYKDSFCYNEELRYINNWDELIDRIEKRPEQYVGFEDPEMLHYIETLYHLFPHAIYILLERDRKESEVSLINKSPIPPLVVRKKFDRWYKDIKKFKELVKEYRCIHWSEMDSQEDVKQIWDYVLPEAEFDVDRWNMLTSLQVAVTIGNKPNVISPTCMAPYFNFEKLEIIK